MLRLFLAAFAACVALQVSLLAIGGELIAGALGGVGEPQALFAAAHASMGLIEALLLALIGTVVVNRYRADLDSHVGWVARMLQMLWSIRPEDHGNALAGLTQEPVTRLRRIDHARYVLAPRFFALAAALFAGGVYVTYLALSGLWAL